VSPVKIAAYRNVTRYGRHEGVWGRGYVNPLSLDDTGWSEYSASRSDRFAISILPLPFG
jgi:hypothetical protein